MTKAIGRLLSAGWAKEATRGTSVAPTFFPPLLDIDFEDQLELKDNEEGLGQIEGINDSQIIKRWAEGKLEGKVHEKSIGVLLTALFGQSPTSVQRASSGVYDHTYTVANNNQHKSLTIAVKDPNLDQRFALAMLDEVEFSMEEDDYFKFDASFHSKKGATASNTIAYVAENEFAPKHAVVKLATSEAGLDAASAIGVKSFSLSISKNVDELMELGSVEPSDIANTNFEVEFEIELYYNDTTYRDLVFNNTRRALRLTVKNTDVDIGSTHNPELTFNMPEVVMSSFEKDFDNDEILTQKIEGKAVFNLAGSKMLGAVLANAYAGTNY